MRVHVALRAVRARSRAARRLAARPAKVSARSRSRVGSCQLALEALGQALIEQDSHVRGARPLGREWPRSRSRSSRRTYEFASHVHPCGTVEEITEDWAYSNRVPAVVAQPVATT